MNLQPLVDNEPSSSGLGSLVQSARRRKLNRARWILIAIGVLQIVLSLSWIGAAPAIIDLGAFQAESNGPMVPSDVRERAIRLTRLLNAVGLAFGVVFVLLGIAIYANPVASTTMGIVVFVGFNTMFCLFDPLAFILGLPVKIPIVVALVRAVYVAIAYEQKRTSAGTPVPSPVI